GYFSHDGTTKSALLIFQGDVLRQNCTAETYTSGSRLQPFFMFAIPFLLQPGQFHCYSKTPKNKKALCFKGL
ncbi:MAG: hypothetical protein ACK5QU_01255, partial [Bacteroidota bacterium]